MPWTLFDMYCFSLQLLDAKHCLQQLLFDVVSRNILVMQVCNSNIEHGFDMLHCSSQH